MAEDKEDQFEHTSDIPPLAMPVFTSKIPPHLLKGASEEAQYILTELSLQSEYLRFVIPVLMATHAEVRRTNGKVKSLNAWRSSIMNWKVMIFAVVTIFGGLFMTALQLYKMFHP